MAATRPYDSRRWRELRKRILERDGHKCVMCGQPATDLDHIEAWTADNRHLCYEPSNLQSLCRSDHVKKTYAQPRTSNYKVVGKFDADKLRLPCPLHGTPPCYVSRRTRDWDNWIPGTDDYFPLGVVDDRPPYP